MQDVHMCKLCFASALDLSHSFDIWLTVGKVTDDLDPNETPSYSASHSDPSCLNIITILGVRQ